MSDLFYYNPATIILIIINLLLSLICFFNKTIMKKLLFIPYQVVHKKDLKRVITSGFIHNDWGHLIFNMFALFSFGFGLEANIGTITFIIIYFFCLVLSHVPALLKHKNNPTYRSLGASGAISGIIFSAILFEPISKIYIYFIPFGIPAFIFGPLYLGYCIYASKMQVKDNIAHDAHFSGAISGLILTMLLFGTDIIQIWEKIFL
jgi:membrane associated rhomboid family serine protease